MRLDVNGVTRDANSATLEALLSEFGFSGRVATALNEEFVPASLRSKTLLKEGDRVEIIAPMQGG